MKIGIDISQIVFKGGVVTYTQNLVTSLLEIDRKNSYTLFGSSLRQQKKIADFFNTLSNKNTDKKLFRLPPILMDFLWNRLHVASIEHFTGNVDIFHSSDWTQPPTRNAKKVTTIHDLAVYANPENIPKKIIDVHKRRLNWVAKECDAIIADSYNTKEDIIKYLKIPDNKIHVIQLGVDKSFSPQGHESISQLKKKYYIEGDYILAFGAPGFRKNVEGVIKSFKKMQKDIPHNLVIIGSTGDAYTDENDRIIRLPYVEFSELPTFYSGASCFVYPSYYEGFGLPILEAMACGCPVVSSDRGSLKEIVGNSLIVDPDDEGDIAAKIHTILTLSDQEYASQVKKGLEHAKQFSWEKTAKETLKIYEEVLQ